MSFNLTNVIFNPLTLLDLNGNQPVRAMPSPAVERQSNAFDAYRTGFSDGYQTGSADSDSQNDWGNTGNAHRGHTHGHENGNRREASNRVSYGGHHNHRPSESGNGYGSGNGGNYGNFGGLGYGGGQGYVDPYGYGSSGNGYGNGMSANHRQRPGGQDGYGHGYGSNGYESGNSSGWNVDGSNRVQPKSNLKASMVGNDAVVTTQSGYKIQVTAGSADAGGQVVITAPNGKTTKLWGDPHVETSNGQKFDFKETLEALLGNNPKDKVEFKTKPGPNGTTVIDSLSVINKETNEGVRVSGVSSGGNLQINRGNGRQLDALLADGTKTYFNADGNGTYTTNNGFGGVDQLIDQAWLTAQESNGSRDPSNSGDNYWNERPHRHSRNS